MAGTIVDRLHSEFLALVALLQSAEPSLLNTAEDTFRKVLLLSAASLFERLVTDSIIEFVSEASAGNECVREFVRRKGLARQYHTLFDWENWEKGNANKFFALFGESFKQTMVGRLKTDPELSDSIRTFLELGNDRNRLTHQDLGQFVLEKTTTEIFDKYQSAARFVEALPNLLRTGSTQS